MFSNQSLSSIMLLAGISLACWTMLRLSWKRRKRLGQNPLAGKEKAPTAPTRLGAKSSREAKPGRAIPLGDAPPEILRWQVAMFDLSREIQAEVQTRVATLDQLSRRVDSQIHYLEQLIQKVDSLCKDGSSIENLPFHFTQAAAAGNENSEARQNSPAQHIPTAQPAVSLSQDLIRQIKLAAGQGHTAKAIAEKFQLSETDIEYLLYLHHTT